MNRIIVVDASAALSVILNEPHRSRILAATCDAVLMSPSSLPFEVANALSARVKRNDADCLAPDLADQAFSAFLDMDIALVNPDREAHRHALQIAASRRMYAYDAYLLELALRYQAELLTLDGSGKKPGLMQHAQAFGVALAPGV